MALNRKKFYRLDFALMGVSSEHSQQKNIVAQLAETTGVPYEVPTTLEAVTCILSEYFRSQNRLFSDSPGTFTRCQENLQGSQIVVGGFATDGLAVCSGSFHDRYIGVAALRKF